MMDPHSAVAAAETAFVVIASSVARVSEAHPGLVLKITAHDGSALRRRRRRNGFCRYCQSSFLAGTA